MLLATVRTRRGTLAVNVNKVTWEMALTVAISTSAKTLPLVPAAPTAPIFRPDLTVHVNQVCMVFSMIKSFA